MIRGKDLNISEPKFNFTKTELLNAIVEAVIQYREYEKKADWQPVAIDTSTIARFIAYGCFESFIGASQHPSWVNLYNRINYFLNKFVEKKVGKWYFPVDFPDKIKKYLNENSDDNDFPADIVDTNKVKEKLKKRIKQSENEPSFKTDFVVINFEDYYEEKKIYECKICKEIFESKNEIINHIRNHSLVSFISN